MLKQRCDISSGSKPLYAQTYPSVHGGRGCPELRKVFPLPISPFLTSTTLLPTPPQTFPCIRATFTCIRCIRSLVYTRHRRLESIPEPGTSSHPSHLCITIHFFREFPRLASHLRRLALPPSPPVSAPYLPPHDALFSSHTPATYILNLTPTVQNLTKIAPRKERL